MVQGADKERVGQVAAEIRRFRRPGVYWANNEPVGIRYANEHVRRKAGKRRRARPVRRGRSQEMSLKSPQERLAFRRIRARRKIFGTAEKPRLSVYRAQRHMYAQLVDDAAGRTLAAASSLVEDLKKTLKTGANVDAATKVGQAIAEKAKALNISPGRCLIGAVARTMAGSKPSPTEPARRA